MKTLDFLLPDDVDALKALVRAMAEKVACAESLESENRDLKALNAAADERIARLTSILKALERNRFGKRSEKLGAGAAAEQQAFVFEEIETGIAEIKASLDKAGGAANQKRAPRLRKAFASHLERIEVVIEPEVPPEHQGKEKIKIGEDVCERLDVEPPRFRVIVTRRPKYAFKVDSVIQAPAPAHIIEGGIPTEALLAMIAVSKYADGLPLYRQEAIYARNGVELDRSLMAQWMGRLGFELEPLSEHVLLRIKQGPRVFADETSCRRWSPAPARRRKPIYGPMRETIGPLAAAIRRWSPTVSRTVAPATALCGISRAITAYFKWTATPPTIGWVDQIAARKPCCWPAAGRICVEDFTNCMSPAAPAWPPPRSSG